MKVIDKTPLLNAQGDLGTLQRLQGTLEFGFNWYPELEAQKVVIAQLDRVLEKGFTLIRNVTLGKSPIVEPLVLIGPPGVYVILVTPLAGFYEAKGDQWNQVRGGRSMPAPSNLLQRVYRLSRALQVYLDRQGVSLPGPVEAVLMSSSPALHIDSLRPMVRVVLSDAIRQFAGSLLQARPVIKPEIVLDIADRIVTQREKTPAAEQLETPQEAKSAEYLPPALRGEPGPDDAPTDAPAGARARAIFHAADTSKPFDASDLNFEFDENAAEAVPQDLRESSPSQMLGTKKRGGLSGRQLLLLGGMLLVECCVLAGFAFLIFSSTR